MKTTLVAKKLGFKPYIWFATPEQHSEEVISRPIQKLDPATVGDPIVAQESGNPIVINAYGIFIGIWGNDVEAIDGIFEKKN